MSDYETMRVDPATDHSVLLIAEHKRQADGPAMIMLDHELQALMDTFVRCVRPQFPSPRDDNIFLQIDGTAFRHSIIGKRLPSIWGKSGVRPDLRVTATNIRKWIVTTCHEKKKEGLPVSEDTLRRAMCHSDKVAKTNYMCEELTRVAAEATKTIALCTRGARSPPPPKSRRLDDQPGPSSEQPVDVDTLPTRNRPLTDAQKTKRPLQNILARTKKSC